MKYTKQGVRDLNDVGKKHVPRILPPECNHKRMKECHPGCGHLICPDCSLTWDTYAEM
jgi:hypothetical protein